MHGQHCPAPPPHFAPHIVAHAGRRPRCRTACSTRRRSWHRPCSAHTRPRAPPVGIWHPYSSSGAVGAFNAGGGGRRSARGAAQYQHAPHRRPQCWLRTWATPRPWYRCLRALRRVLRQRGGGAKARCGGGRRGGDHSSADRRRWRGGA